MFLSLTLPPPQTPNQTPTEKQNNIYQNILLS